MSIKMTHQTDLWHQRKPLGSHMSHSSSGVGDVRIDFGRQVAEVTREIPWSDRAITQLYRMRSDAIEGFEEGTLIGLGSALGSGVGTLVTLGGMSATEGVEGAVIATGLSLGAFGAVGAGFGMSRIRGALSFAGVAGLVAGSYVALSIESASDVITGAVLSTGAANGAAITAGVFFTVLSGIIARRNWT